MIGLFSSERSRTPRYDRNPAVARAIAIGVLLVVVLAGGIALIVSGLF